MTKQPPIAKADLQKTQGNRAPAAVKNSDVISFINQPSMKEQLAAALPRHMTAERMIRIATWICPYISRHLLSLNPLLACCRRYSRGER